MSATNLFGESHLQVNSWARYQYNTLFVKIAFKEKKKQIEEKRKKTRKKGKKSIQGKKRKKKNNKNKKNPIEMFCECVIIIVKN